MSPTAVPHTVMSPMRWPRERSSASTAALLGDGRYGGGARLDAHETREPGEVVLRSRTPGTGVSFSEGVSPGSGEPGLVHAEDPSADFEPAPGHPGVGYRDKRAHQVEDVAGGAHGDIIARSFYGACPPFHEGAAAARRGRRRRTSTAPPVREGVPIARSSRAGKPAASGATGHARPGDPSGREHR